MENILWGGTMEALSQLTLLAICYLPISIQVHLEAPHNRNKVPLWSQIAEKHFKKFSAFFARILRDLFFIFFLLSFSFQQRRQQTNKQKRGKTKQSQANNNKSAILVVVVVERELIGERYIYIYI